MKSRTVAIIAAYLTVGWSLAFAISDWGKEHCPTSEPTTMTDGAIVSVFWPTIIGGALLDLAFGPQHHDVCIGHGGK